MRNRESEIVANSLQVQSSGPSTTTTTSTQGYVWFNAEWTARFTKAGRLCVGITAVTNGLSFTYTTPGANLPLSRFNGLSGTATFLDPPFGDDFKRLGWLSIGGDFLMTVVDRG
jgi:hypothetical protein